MAKDWADYKDEVSEEIRWTVWEMRKHDVVRPYANRGQHYLDVNGFSYWTMGPREEDDFLINRQYSTHGAYESPFDAIAHRYDDSDKPWYVVKTEREALYEPAKPSGRVLDVGCGTGLLAVHPGQGCEVPASAGTTGDAREMFRLRLRLRST